MGDQIIESTVDHADFRRIFVETFSNEPSFRFMLPDDRTRKNHVAWLVDKKIKLFSQSYYTLTTQGQIRGFAWWIPPGHHVRSTILAQLKVGYWKAPFIFGLNSFLRMYHFSNQESQILKKYYEEPYWILDVIAADPRFQRGGLGGALMNPVFQKSREQKIPCFVLTHNPRNVGFYEKYGFQLKIQEPVMGPGTPVAYGLERSWDL